MTPYPADFGGYVIGALPYAGAEALRIAAWCIAFVAPVAAACWLLGRARRLARPSTPGIRHLHRAAANADDRHAPVTRELPLGDLVVSREVERYAAHKANAPTEAIDPDPALGCPCCTGTHERDTCTCAVPCGYGVCQAIDPADGCTWCVTPYAWPCTCAIQCGDPACVAGVTL